MGIGLAASATVFGFSGAVAGRIILLVGTVVLAVAFGFWDQVLWAPALAILSLLFLVVIEFLSASWLGLGIAVALLAYLVAVSGHFD